MNLKDQHTGDKAFSAHPIFKDGIGTVVSIQIRNGETFPEHMTQTAAVVVCVSGEVLFEYAHGEKSVLKSGDYISITPLEKHWLVAAEESQLLLMK